MVEVQPPVSSCVAVMGPATSSTQATAAVTSTPSVLGTRPSHQSTSRRSQAPARSRDPRVVSRARHTAACAPGSPYVVVMPIVDVTYGSEVAEERHLRLGRTLQ